MNRQRYTLQDISPHILTTNDLIDRKYSQNKIRKLVAQGELLKLRKGAYIESNFWFSCQTFERYLAEILAFQRLFPNTVFSHETAAVIHGLAVPFVPASLHIYVTKSSNGQVYRAKKHHQLVDTTELTHHLYSLVTTGLKTTVLDCSKTLSLKESVAIADSSVYRKGLYLGEVQQLLKGATGRGCKTAHRTADLISKYAESPGESYVRLLLQQMGLRFKEQVKMSINGRSYRVDFVLLDYPIVIEFDGKIKLTEYETADVVLAAERTREIDIQNTGWFVFRTGWRDSVIHPEIFKGKLDALLMSVKQMRDTWASVARGS